VPLDCVPDAASFTNELKESKRVEEIGLPNGIRAYDKANGRDIDLRVEEGLEVLQNEGLDQTFIPNLQRTMIDVVGTPPSVDSDPEVRTLF
jgi:hypothetical protein